MLPGWAPYYAYVTPVTNPGATKQQFQTWQVSGARLAHLDCGAQSVAYKKPFLPYSPIVIDPWWLRSQPYSGQFRIGQFTLIVDYLRELGGMAIASHRLS